MLSTVAISKTKILGSYYRFKNSFEIQRKKTINTIQYHVSPYLLPINYQQRMQNKPFTRWENLRKKNSGKFRYQISGKKGKIAKS